MYKKILSTWLLFVTVFIVFVGGVNYVVDPLFMFNNNNRTNEYKLNINERLQKSNLLYYGHYSDFKQLIIGTSRMTYIDQNKFKNKTFNYAVSSMSPYEYKYYIDFAMQFSNVERIYIELFPVIRFKDEELKNKVNVFNHNIFDDKFHKLKETFSFSTFIFSLKTIFTQFKINNPFTKFGHRFYRKNNVADCLKIKPEEVESLIDYSVKSISNVPVLSDDYLNELRFLKENYPNIVVIVPPSSMKYFNYIKSKHSAYYKKWLKNIVDIFGEVYVFLHNNKVMKNYKANFKDSIHFYPNVGDLMIKQLDSEFNTDENFGKKITKENIDVYFKEEHI